MTGDSHSAADPAPEISVITPCYQQAHYLPNAIDSVRRQQNLRVEHIIVNDGSTDDTEAVALGAPDVRYVAQANGGLSAARNAGLAVARGRYCLFLDADDLLAPDALTTLHDAVGGGALRIGFGAWCHFIGQPPLADECTPQLPHVTTPPMRGLIHGNIGPVHAFLAPTDLLRTIGGFRTDLRACEDWDCWVRMVAAGASFVVVPRVVALYRDTPESLSKNHALMLRSRVQVLLSACDAVTALRAEETMGPELLAACTRVLRRLLVQGADGDTVRAVRTRLAALQRQQHQEAKRSAGSIARRIMGTYAEDAAVAWMKLAAPTRLEEYRRGWH